MHHQNAKDNNVINKASISYHQLKCFFVKKLSSDVHVTATLTAPGNTAK